MRLQGRIERKTHDVEDLRAAHQNWDEMSEKEKYEASQSVEPIDSGTTFNVTTDELHQYFARNLDPNDDSADANLDAAWVGLGTDASSGTETSHTDINNRTYEETTTDSNVSGKDVLVATFLDSNEGNGNDFDEIGLFTGDPANIGDADTFLINHATFSPVTKDNTRTVTFDVTLTFSDV